MPVKSPVRNTEDNTETQSPAGAGKGHSSVSIIDTIPIKVVLSLASPYLAGETPEEAIAMAHQLYEKEHYTSTLDILGEDMHSAADCDASVEAYKKLAAAISKRRLPQGREQERMTISLKPSMFSIRAPQGSTHREDPELQRAVERIRAVTAYAKELGINVTLEAEDQRWTDFQLDTYVGLIEEGFTNLGTVLQSRLFRTADDLLRFDGRMRVRMVIGIYNEPAEISHTDKDTMKDLLVEYARTLLARGVYVEVATHDLDCIHKFFEKVVIPDGIEASRFETQFLHGVPREELQKGLVDGSYFSSTNFPSANADALSKLSQSGVVVRKYLPFGPGNVAGAYCRRRLKENPNMITYGIKNFFKWQR